MKRHRDALGIQEGARNVRAIAKSLLEASDEAVREGVGAEQDAAVRMIVHQLARVCNVDEINFGYDAANLKDVYCILMSECERRANEVVVHPERSEAGREVEMRSYAPGRRYSDRAAIAVMLHDDAAKEGQDGQGGQDAPPARPPSEGGGVRKGFFGFFRLRG